MVVVRYLYPMEAYCNSLINYSRLKTKPVRVGDLIIGNGHPIVIQTMTTTNTMDTRSTVQQTIRCIEAGAQIVRITAPSVKDAENLAAIKDDLRKSGYHTPLVADIHFTPNAALIAARIVEKVRINPGNFVDKKKFEVLEYDERTYQEEIERIRDRFVPLIKVCKQYGTALRIGTNHGSLSDRIMSRYGDTPEGMVESAIEFLDIARAENFHEIVLSMKSSNPQVMVAAYRMLVVRMQHDYQECYPLHLGVTEAGDGEDGRIKSAEGIGTLLEDGVGDTIRVSLTENPEAEIPVCKDIIARYDGLGETVAPEIPSWDKVQLPYNPFHYQLRSSNDVHGIGGHNPSVVISDLSYTSLTLPGQLAAIGYHRLPDGSWKKDPASADYLYLGGEVPSFTLPASLDLLMDAEAWNIHGRLAHTFPLYDANCLPEKMEHAELNFLRLDVWRQNEDVEILFSLLKSMDSRLVLIIRSSLTSGHFQALRRFLLELMDRALQVPVILELNVEDSNLNTSLVNLSIESGALLLDGLINGLFFRAKDVPHLDQLLLNRQQDSLVSRSYRQSGSADQFLLESAFGILQAARARIVRTEFISCPSCGRTLFDIQDTTEKIRKLTGHLKGVKIAVMGCIVNGLGEMADADFGYVGSGHGKITLFKGREMVKKNLDSSVAVQELIELLKENKVWVDPSTSEQVGL